ncbi:pectinesterase family protein [Lachnoclostridium phytofermentans]|uniref:pectinesterase family protein n=1 Tax=Lachnoclostridium phytofermentans TaxID=66219 RepID=UPI00068BE873|nr:pectinesterase family protein [Lachnoclostridium phytofermentans]
MKKGKRKWLAILLIVAMLFGILPGQYTVANASGSLIDVWDFGAEQLDPTIYNNKLSVDVINNCYPSVASGSSIISRTLPGFSIDGGDFMFSDGGFSTSHRLRTINQDLIRYDDKSLTDSYGKKYNGYLYSNKEKSTGVYIGIQLQKNDILTVIMSSNKASSNVVIEAPNGAIKSQVHTLGGSMASEFTYYAAENGLHKIYSTDDKLVVARVYRQHTSSCTITGTVTAPSELTEPYSIMFTNNKTGEAIVAPIVSNNYTATLNETYDYSVSLVGADGYVISEGASVVIPSGSTLENHNITVVAVPLITLTGTITGLTPEELQKVNLSFRPVIEQVFVPSVIIDRVTGDYTATLENNITYVVSALNVNDYSLGVSEFTGTTNETKEMAFTKKPVYDITLNLVGLSAEETAGATTTFTNLNEEGYSYSFVGTQNIKLRDGTYSVKVNSPKYQKLTPNLIISGSAVQKTVEFEEPTVWEFSNPEFTANGTLYNFYGLSMTGISANKGLYAVGKTGAKVELPVNGPCQIVVSFCYKASALINNDSVNGEFSTISGSTSNIETVSYIYKGSESNVAIDFNGETYLTKIELLPIVPIKTTLTVGSIGCDYTTIQAALEAVKVMERTNNERITIEIQPGNYEEMLVIDVPNVTLKNASATPSIELTNKGVNIAPEAVRITSYYGHGYSYYSMGSDFKWDEETLNVNKANGYHSKKNDGAGTATFWNATVVVAASGFEAEGIIFENSFNQYISVKEAADTLYLESDHKGERSKVVGDTSVQNKSFVERAAALAIANNVDKTLFRNCRFVGRQDTLYGGSNVRAAFDKCAIMGGTDFIFGPMTAAFYKCDLVMNTSEGSTDVSYITAAQQASGRGYLMYNCHITSTVPGVDTASATYSKPGYFGRPWKGETSEVVFFKTVIENTDFDGYQGQSLILPIGWNSTLGGTSPLCYEYGTMERGTHDHAQRATWAKNLKDPVLSDGTSITIDAFLNGSDSWNPIVMDTEESNLENIPGFDIEIPTPTPVPGDTEASIDIKNGLKTGTTYGGAAGITVLDNMTYSPDEKVINGITYSGYVAGAVNPSPSNGAVPTMGAVVKVSPTVDGSFSIVLKLNQGKTLYVIDKNGSQVDKIAASATEFIEKKYEMKAGDTYFIYGGGTKIPVYGLSFKKAAVKHVLDLSTGLKAGTDYHGIEVLQDMAYKADSQTIEGTPYAGCIAGTSNPSPNKGDIPTSGSVVKVTPEEDGKFTVVFKLNSTKNYYLVDSSKNIIATYTAGSSNEYIAKTVEVSAGKSYYFYGDGTKLPIYGLSIVYGDDSVAWGDIEAPSISNVVVNGNTITVDYLGKVGNGYADSIAIEMYEGDILKKIEKISAPGNGGTVTFTPDASGSYQFKAVLSRGNEADKSSVKSQAVDFILPLAKPEIQFISNKGNGSIKVVWNKVAEATGYEVFLSENGGNTFVKKLDVTATKATLTGLSIGSTYYIKVKAIRGNDSIESDTVSKIVKAEAEISWNFSAFGSGVNTIDNGYDDSVDGLVKVWSTNGKGKLVPASTDGLAFYYTMVDTSENFKLSATVKVDNWKFSNGQEGFGLMAADAVGKNLDSTAFWNNSYMASVTKVEYLWDAEQESVSDDGEKITMKLGVGAQEKIGVTQEKIDLMNQPNSNLTSIPGFSSTMATLETSCAKNGAGTYNIVKNYTNDELVTEDFAMDEFKLTIERDNTGYRISFIDYKGNVQKETYYDVERVSLSGIDKDNVYVGFFASRNASITVTDIKLTTSDPATDPPAEERPIKKVTPIYKVVSANAVGTSDYDLVYRGNADGVLTITDSFGRIITKEEHVSANTNISKRVSLNKGNNIFTITFTPDEDYIPGEFMILKDYDTRTFTHSVVYKTYGNEGQTIYVSPQGTSNGLGTKANPLDIYTAVKHVQPSQTIVLIGGRYSLNKTITIERGVSGTADKKIYLVADPNSSERPVFDFNGASAGMILAGDYWYFKGFDVTKTKDAQKGIQLSGSNCTLDQVNTYYNGNTGIQISRYQSYDEKEQWPANNLVLNCTSYGNADKGYEDADGFAAKLTIGEGNIFDGCIAYNNADDGWDLFAKVETGPIGKVVIRNSVAFRNGYLPDGTNAGNGNGFKMGGESITGRHELINSVAFDNKAKGIDSNSGPDIQVYHSTSFNNEKNNVAFYTNNAKNTDFLADGVLSFKTLYMNENENLKLLGSQEESKVRGENNYYWEDGKSSNTKNVEVSSDWFVNLDTKIEITRNADGTINMNGLLELAEKAPKDTGARMAGTPSNNIAIGPEVSESETLQPTDTPAPTVTPTPTATPTPTKELTKEEIFEHLTPKRTGSLYTGGKNSNLGWFGLKLPKNVVKVANFDEETLSKLGEGIVPIIITYTSNKPGIVIVKQNGRLIAKESGVAIITATVTMQDGTKEVYTRKLSVKKATVDFVESTVRMKVGEEAVFEVKVNGLDVDSIIWMSSKKDGAVVKKNPGSTTATIKAVSPTTDWIYVIVDGVKKAIKVIIEK